MCYFLMTFPMCSWIPPFSRLSFHLLHSANSTVCFGKYPNPVKHRTRHFCWYSVSSFFNNFTISLNGVHDCPIIFLPFPIMFEWFSLLIQNVSKLWTLFLVGFARFLGLHCIPKRTRATKFFLNEAQWVGPCFPKDILYYIIFYFHYIVWYCYIVCLLCSVIFIMLYHIILYYF